MSDTATEAPEVPKVEPVVLENAPKDSGRYAAFRQDLGQYVGGVHDSEAKARKAGQERTPKGTPLVVREV